eukprot:COSAG04_NODE_15018_length_546_cov_2.002237_1_plen_181_part_11
MNGDELGTDCGGSCTMCPPPPPPPPPPCDEGCCTAKNPQVITCGQPADGDTICPDNVDDCVFTPAGTCSDTSATTELACLALDPAGTWTPAGTCSDTSAATEADCLALDPAGTWTERGSCALTGWDACQTALNVLPTAFGEQVLWPNAVDAGAWTTLVDCSQATGGYVPGDATNPSTTCPA